MSFLSVPSPFPAAHKSPGLLGPREKLWADIRENCWLLTFPKLFVYWVWSTRLMLDSIFTIKFDSHLLSPRSWEQLADPLSSLLLISSLFLLSGSITPSVKVSFLPVWKPCIPLKFLFLLFFIFLFHTQPVPFLVIQSCSCPSCSFSL